jgi:hypothetical protein
VKYQVFCSLQSLPGRRIIYRVYLGRRILYRVYLERRILYRVYLERRILLISLSGKCSLRKSKSKSQKFTSTHGSAQVHRASSSSSSVKCTQAPSAQVHRAPVSVHRPSAQVHRAHRASSVRSAHREREREFSWFVMLNSLCACPLPPPPYFFIESGGGGGEMF